MLTLDDWGTGSIYMTALFDLPEITDVRVCQRATTHTHQLPIMIKLG